MKDYIIIIESIFVGLYTLCLFNIINIVKIFTFNNQIFLLGFMKHFLGYYLGLHTYYCKYGYSCNNQNKIADSTYIIIDSIMEGFLFLFIFKFILLNTIDEYKIIIVGFLLHFIFDILSLHKIFCKYRCINIDV
jgi:hypothetical protein